MPRKYPAFVFPGGTQGNNGSSYASVLKLKNKVGSHFDDGIAWAPDDIMTTLTQLAEGHSLEEAERANRLAVSNIWHKIVLAKVSQVEIHDRILLQLCSMQMWKCLKDTLFIWHNIPKLKNTCRELLQRILGQNDEPFDTSSISCEPNVSNLSPAKQLEMPFENIARQIQCGYGYDTILTMLKDSFYLFHTGMKITIPPEDETFEVSMYEGTRLNLGLGKHKLYDDDDFKGYYWITQLQSEQGVHRNADGIKLCPGDHLTHINNVDRQEVSGVELAAVWRRESERGDYILKFKRKLPYHGGKRTHFIGWTREECEFAHAIIAAFSNHHLNAPEHITLGDYLQLKLRRVNKNEMIKYLKKQNETITSRELFVELSGREQERIEVTESRVSSVQCANQMLNVINPILNFLAIPECIIGSGGCLPDTT